MIDLIRAVMDGNWITKLLGGWTDENGYYEQVLSSKKALSYAPIWHGVSKIAGHIGQLPCNVYRRLDGGGAEPERMHVVQRLLKRPNPYQSSIVFREQIATHSILDGNGRAAIIRNGNTPVELIPLDPERTATVMIEGIKVHGTRPNEHDRLRRFKQPINDELDGLIMLDDSEVVHIVGLTLDGVTGLSLKQIAQRNLNASINAEKRLASQMENGFSGTLMLESPPGVFRQQKDADEFLDAFEKRHGSPEKAGKAGLLREGIKANILSMSNKEAEMIENRRFQRQDAALYLGLESILGDDNSVSYNSLEQKVIAYLQNCLNRWLVRFEQEIEYKLFPKRQFEAETHFIRFNTAALLKSDYKTSIEALGMAITHLIMSPNEARAKLDMNPYPGGDEFVNPAIQVKEQANDQEDPPEDTTKAPKTDRTARAAIDSRLGHLLKAEANRVISAAEQAVEKGKNFVAWTDDFYAKWVGKLADTLEELGLDREEAAIHCHESQRRLLDACDNATTENLVQVITDCVQNWPSRAANFGIMEAAA